MIYFAQWILITFALTRPLYLWCNVFLSFLSRRNVLSWLGYHSATFSVPCTDAVMEQSAVLKLPKNRSDSVCNTGISTKYYHK